MYCQLKWSGHDNMNTILTSQQNTTQSTKLAFINKAFITLQHNLHNHQKEPLSGTKFRAQNRVFTAVQEACIAHLNSEETLKIMINYKSSTHVLRAVKESMYRI